jgi:amino acid adenylation domain-containing protein/non-ribosomal peptide synthase protein (TIGR01720 family)
MAVPKEFSGTDLEFPRDACVHEIFSEQARRTPGAAAIIHEGREISFAELDELTSQLGTYLRSLGVAPGVRVAFCLERGTDLLIAILGIWKAGGAYVPLDPSYPEERLAYLLEDAVPRVILCQEHLRERLPAQLAKVIALDGEWLRIKDELPTTVANQHSTPEDVAYVIYTSGSTGQPKGVMVTHRNILYFWAAAEQAIHSQHQARRVGVNAPIAFDMSVKQLVQLLSGRALIFVPQEIRLETGMFLDFIAANRIDVLDTTPSQLAGLLASGLLQRTGHQLTTVLVGGESISSAMWRVLAESSRIRFYNMYGPTEATVDATATPIAGDHPHIGRPLANARIYILDPQGETVPIGAAGEIHIGGAGVARGYLGRPGLTEQRFVKDPFSAIEDARMYRTGDIGRWRPDGSIEFVGRNDSQVKIRGFRIELGELEAQLRLHDKVKEAVVLACTVSEGDTRLAAYVTARAEAPTSEELREHLKTLLPEPLVPTAFSVLATMPLNPNGKLDRTRLPSPQWRSQTAKIGFASPQPGIEQTLASLWQEVLRCGSVGRHDNFWELGGDSILAIQVAGLARRAGIALSVQQLYLHKTLSAVSTSLNTARATTVELATPLTCSTELPLMPLQRYFLACTGEEAFFKDILIMRLDCRMELTTDSLRSAMRHVVEYHDGLRIRMTDMPNRPLLRVAPTDSLDTSEMFQHLDLSSLPTAAQERALNEVASRLRSVGDISSIPMVRLVKVDLGSGRFQLILGAHRIIWDPITAGIFFDDLFSASSQLQRQRTPRLPARTTSLHEWAQHLATAGVSWALGHEHHWREQLTAKSTTLPLDGDRDGPYKFYHVQSRLDVAETSRLRALTQRLAAKTEEILLGALAQALSVWTGSPDVAIGLMNNGREPLFSGIDVCRTVGWLSTEYPVVLRPSETDSTAAVVQSVQQCIRSVPGHGLGYLILRSMGDADLLMSCPMPGVVFNYVGAMNRDDDSPVRLLRGDWKSDEELRAREHSRLHINSSINENSLDMVFTSNETFLKRATVERLAEATMSRLRVLLDG